MNDVGDEFVIDKHYINTLISSLSGYRMNFCIGSSDTKTKLNSNGGSLRRFFSDLQNRTVAK